MHTCKQCTHTFARKYAMLTLFPRSPRLRGHSTPPSHVLKLGEALFNKLFLKNYVSQKKRSVSVKALTSGFKESALSCPT